jgi:hypothetical protein
VAAASTSETLAKQASSTKVWAFVLGVLENPRVLLLPRRNLLRWKGSRLFEVAAAQEVRLGILLLLLPALRLLVLMM